MTQITSDKRDIILKKLQEAKRGMGAIRKDSTNPFHKSKYAALPAFIEATEDALDACGLILYACLGEHNGKEVLISTLEHVESGQWIRSYAPLLNVKGDSQGLGSSITYMRRYAMGALLNLCPEDDDDGNRACAPAPKKAPAPQPQAADERISDIELEMLKDGMKLADTECVKSICEDLKKNNFNSLSTSIPKSLYIPIMNTLRNNIELNKNRQRQAVK